MPRERRDRDENERSTRRNHVQRKGQWQPFQYNKELMGQRAQSKPERNGDQRCRQGQEEEDE
jgi:hypothetical protein